MARILLIDDEEEPRENYRELFEKAGHEVVTAIYAREALQKFIEQRPDVVVTGVCMIDYNPIMGVRELVDRMKSIDPGVPIIILTVHKTWEDCFIKGHIAAFVGKYKEEEGLLLQAIEDCLRSDSITKAE